MKFEPGDVIEVIAHPKEISGDCPVRPGMRGVIVEFSHSEVSITLSGIWRGRWWRCEIAGVAVTAEEAVIRKVPPDPGRQLVEWDWRTLKSPELVP